MTYNDKGGGLRPPLKPEGNKEVKSGKLQEGVGILPLKPGRTRLVIGTNGYWAKDDDITKARRKAHFPQHFNCYDVSEATIVDSMGSMKYPGDAVKDAPILLWKQ